MSFTKEQIKKSFSELFGINPRDSQLEIIFIAVNSESPSTIINAGTGIGKSLIAVCVSYMLGGGYIVAPNRPLQWQYENDPFLENLLEEGTLAILMGRGNYPCRLKGCSLCEKNDTEDCTCGNDCLSDYDDDSEYGEITNCSQVSYEEDCKGCRFSVKNSFDEDICFYQAARERASQAMILIINTAIIGYLPIIFKDGAKKPIIIYDEAHQLDSFYRMLCTKNLFNKNILAMLQMYVDEDIPHSRTYKGKLQVKVLDYLEHFHPGQTKLIKDHKNKSRMTTKFISDMVISEPSAMVIIETYIKNVEKLKEVKALGSESKIEVYSVMSTAIKIKDNLKAFLTKISFSSKNDTDIFLRYEPILVDFMHAHVGTGESPAPKEFLMSATIFKGYNDKILGIENADYHEFDNGFKPENSKIFIVENMGAEWANRNIFLKWVPCAIDRILRTYDKRSLIHTQSKQNLDAIISGLSDHIKERLIVVNSVTEYRKRLDEYMSSENAIMISASLREGIDLKDDLCRRVIIISLAVPHPNSADIIGYKNILGLDAYSYAGATALCQSMGRAVRSADDYANIFILDNRLLEKRSKFYKFMPPQWRRALSLMKKGPLDTKL